MSGIERRLKRLEAAPPSGGGCDKCNRAFIYEDELPLWKSERCPGCGRSRSAGVIMPRQAEPGADLSALIFGDEGQTGRDGGGPMTE